MTPPYDPVANSTRAYELACELARNGHQGLRDWFGCPEKQALKAPFPWFGGKSRVAADVWPAFGKVANYVEPFFGSGAVLLARPDIPRIETVNDKDGLLANFWRSVQKFPEETASHADHPVNENDLHARHSYLVSIRDDFVARLEGNADYCDPQIAGWWCWGICCWIGRGWCSGIGPWSVADGKLVKGDAGQGVNRQLVHLGDAGKGVNRELGGGIYDWFAALSDRLRRVRVCCGDWSRVCGPSVTHKNGLTGVFLDPPYSAEANRDNELYRVEDLDVAHNVRDWCLANGNNPLMRIALCGYDGEHNALESAGWRVHAWKARGGYGNQGDGQGRENAGRERIWFSPHCLTSRLDLFSCGDAK